MTVPNSPPDSTTASTTSASASTSQKRRRRRSSSPPAALGATEQGPNTETGTPVPSTAASSATTTSSFRNVSACNRCRLRKNRCDQRLPACLSCEKAGVKCVGYDPITKREIPRSYVHYLERRNEYLESLLTSNQIPFHPPDYFDLPALPSAINTSEVATPPTNSAKSPSTPATTIGERSPTVQKRQRLSEERGEADESSSDSQGRLNQLVSDIGLISVQGASDPRYLGSVSGISFARVVFAAVKSTANSTANNNSNNGGGHYSTEEEAGGDGSGSGNTAKSGKEDTAMRDSFFGLATNKKRVRPAKWPSRNLANRLVDLYFGHANPQLPILHKVEFEAMVDQVYSIMKAERVRRERGDSETATSPRRKVGARELYMMNIVFAIGAGIFLEKDAGNSSSSGSSDDEVRRKRRKKTRVSKARPVGGDGEQIKENPITPGSSSTSPRATKKARLDREDDVKQESLYESEEDGEDNDIDQWATGREERQYAPEAYHAAALPHLEAFLSSESKGGLEELQAVLLLAGYALLRPVAPGLWYIVGVAVRLAVDLGLHFEDSNASSAEGALNTHIDQEIERLRGRIEWVKDLRRKLWWCTYSLDRLVSTCVGRPFGIQDEVVSTRFPSLLPDEYITPQGFKSPPQQVSGSIAPVLPTYKLITHHYFRLRLLQSEILQVLQQQQSMSTSPPQEPYPSHHPFHLRTPYLRNFATVQEWHSDVTHRVKEWIETAPKSKAETGVDFAFEFFELNYWQTVLMLYRPCLKVPALLSGELGGGRGMIDAGGKGVGIGQLRGGHSSGRGDMGGLTSGTLDEEEKIYYIVADAGSKVLKLYRRLHRVHQVNYTFLATHHLFMSGIAFLYAIWHSPSVRSRLSMDDIDFTILAATSVLGDLVEKCPPAQACKEAFERMSKATVSMCLASNSGPGSIPRMLGNMGIGNDPNLDREVKKRIGARSGYIPSGNSIGHSQRNRVLKDLSGGFEISNNNQMLLQQQSNHLRRQQQMQQFFPQQDQRWQRHMQYQQQQQQLQQQQQQQQQKQQQQQARRINPMRTPAIFDMGLETLFQSGNGVQMSESSYRSTQQPTMSRRPQTFSGPSTEVNRRNELHRQISVPISEAEQHFGSPPPLTSPLQPPLSLDQQLQVHIQSNFQREDDDSNNVLANQTSPSHDDHTSPLNNETNIDPELQREEIDSLSIKPSPHSEEIMHPSPSMLSDASGVYGNNNATGMFDIPGFDNMDWGNWGEFESSNGGGIEMGMGMGMGQVDLFDGFFFGSGGVGGS